MVCLLKRDGAVKSGKQGSGAGSREATTQAPASAPLGLGGEEPQAP